MQLIVKDDKLQKYRDHIQQGRELGEADKKYFDRYFFAFTLLLDGLSERKVVESLMYSPNPLGGLSQSMAYNVVNGCQQIFGALDFGNAKKLAQRQVYAVRLEEIAYTLEESGLKLLHQAEKRGEDADGNEFKYLDGEEQERASKILEQSAKVRMQAAKIRGLMEKDKVENPNKFKVAPNIIFTDDIAALQMYREIEDAQFDDVTGDENQAG